MIKKMICVFNFGKKFHLVKKNYFYYIKTTSENRRLFSSSSSINPKQSTMVWDRLIRFVGEDQKIHLGQPIIYSSSSEGNGVVGKDEQASDGLKVNVIDGDVFDETAKITDKVMTVKKILAPLSQTQIPIIRCIGLNYKAHAHEASLPLPKHPILFIKPSTSLQNPNDKILATNDRTDYEGELAVVLKKDCKNVDVENALDYVLGYTCANDVSDRKWQEMTSGQWCFSKGFDTFCPIGPVLVSPKLIENPNSLGIRTIVNGRVLQNSNTRDMIFDVRRLISFLSKGTTLQKGSMILTGTPEGVGFTRDPPIFLQHKDTVTVEIDKIGSLTNTVEYENIINQ